MTELPKSADRTDALRRLLVETVEETHRPKAERQGTCSRRGPVIAAVAAGALASVVAVGIAVMPGIGGTGPGIGTLSGGSRPRTSRGRA